MCGVHYVDAGGMSLWAADDAAGAAGGFSPSAPMLSVAPASTPSLLTGDVSIAANAPSGLPWLHSLPGARVAIFLDFDGFGTNTSYDTDGQPATFGANEQRDITEAWRHIASYFSMFNADVTTQQPTGTYSYSIITNSHPDSQPGYSYLQFPTTNPSAYNPSGDARGRQSGIAHEIGHNFSLAHQSDFDLLGEKTNEYSSGFDLLHGPVMGVDYAQTVHKWFLGHPSHSPSLLQDDVAVIADKINNYSGGDGFRADDVGNTIATARVLAADASGLYSASGIIERMTDADAFGFESYGGQVRIDVATPQPSMLDAKLEVYDAAGNLVAAVDGSTNDQHLSVPVVGAGTFYAVVTSHGNYGDLGPYDLTVRSLPAEFTSRDVGAVTQKGVAAYDGADGSYSVSGGGADIGGTADEFHFAYTQLVGDGSITARVLSQENTSGRAPAGVMIRESLGAGSRHATLATTPTGGVQFRSRSSTNGSTTPVAVPGLAAPQWVRLERTGSTVKGYRSVDGTDGSWVEQGTMTLPATTAPVYIGLAVSAGNDASLSDAKFDSVALQALNGGVVGAVGPTYSAIPTPTGLTLGRADTGTGLQVSWDAVPGAGGYFVERSLDGATWTSGGFAAEGVTTWGDASLAGGLRSFYRVSAQDNAGRSAPSAPLSIVTRPSAPTNLSVTSWQTDKLILNWRDTTGETGYRIERAPEGSSAWVVRGNVGRNVPSFTDTGLSPATTYQYRVVATSDFGDATVATTTGTTRLAAVTGVTFTEKLFNRLSLRWNATPGATSYRILRSTNGTDYTTLATVAGTTYDDRGVAAVREYYYRVVGITSRAQSVDGPADAAFAATPAAAALPVGWQSRDVGTVGGSGASGFTGAGTAGTFTVLSSGADVGGTADAFRFTYHTLVGDGTITARVVTQEDTNGWAKAGVMIRETTSANSRHAFMMVTPDNGAVFQHRTAAGGQANNASSLAGAKAPYWVRLERRGNTVIASRSTDGVAWTTQGTVTLSMARSVFIGLAATAAMNTQLGSVTFNNVSLSNQAPTVATPAAAAPAVVTAVSTSLSVLGADDHGEPLLTYTWSATTLPEGAAAPTFSDNGTNAARNVTATFTMAGTYLLQARVADAAGLSAVSAVTVVVERTPTALAILPAAPVVVAPGGTVQFSATMVDQFGQALPGPVPVVTWSTTGGSIGADGLFTAPSRTGTYSITALGELLGGSVDVVVDVPDTTAPTLRSVSSRKTHGARGDFDLPLSLSAGDTSATVEPRLGGPTLLRFVFDEPVVAEDGTLDASEFLISNATFGGAQLDAAKTVLTLTLSGVADRSVVTVTVAGLSDLSGNPLSGDSDVSVRSLFGDVNGNGVVNDMDVLLVRRALFRGVTEETFLADLDLDGTVDTFDLLHARRGAGGAFLG